MELGELSIGLRVRIPAFEKGNAGRGRACHYAYVRDIVDSVFGAEKTVLVSIPVLHADKAKVLAITDLKGNNPIEQIKNNSYTPSILYKVNEMIYPDSFDEDRWNECSHGIHFFISKQEAIDY